MTNADALETYYEGLRDVAETTIDEGIKEWALLEGPLSRETLIYLAMRQMDVITPDHEAESAEFQESHRRIREDLRQRKVQEMAQKLLDPKPDERGDA